jgi:hypothetical protein
MDGASGSSFCWESYLVFHGTATLQGGLHYSNYWGGAVFAPFAITVGVFLLLVALLYWQRFDQAGGTSKLKDREARLVRQAADEVSD